MITTTVADSLNVTCLKFYDLGKAPRLSVESCVLIGSPR